MVTDTPPTSRAGRRYDLLNPGRQTPPPSRNRSAQNWNVNPPPTACLPASVQIIHRPPAPLAPAAPVDPDGQGYFRLRPQSVLCTGVALRMDSEQDVAFPAAHYCPFHLWHPGRCLDDARTMAIISSARGTLRWNGVESHCLWPDEVARTNYESREVHPDSLCWCAVGGTRTPMVIG